MALVSADEITPRICRRKSFDSASFSCEINDGPRGIVEIAGLLLCRHDLL